jgi:phosphoribosylformylglycinamidine cyclo-ligase
MRYRDAGVDLDRSFALKDDIVRAVESTWTPAVAPLPGGFAGLMEWPAGRAGLVAATLDGVGTKLHLAQDAGRVDDAAADLVFHGANDLLVHGARPLAFLDYIAQARLDPATVAAAVTGLARACREVGAVLLGGETAEMPDTYLPGVVDVAGCMIGCVAPEELLDGRATRPGDAVLGLHSDGLHTNGFSLARAVLRKSGRTLAMPLPGGAGESIAAALLAPHRWYGRALLPLTASGRLHALAHVTGGGVAGNLSRVLPEGCRARVRTSASPRPDVFRWLIEEGDIPEDDARRAFNLGIGMIAVCAADDAEEISRALVAAGERVTRIGEIVAGPRGVDWIDSGTG